MAKTIQKTIFASLPVEQHGNTITWRRYGGNAGKTLDTIVQRASKAGFTLADHSLTGTPDGSHMGGGGAYKGPNNESLLVTYSYGVTKDKNRFSAILQING